MSYIKGKNKNTILEEMYGTASPCSVVHEQQKMAIPVRCTEDIEKVMQESSKSAERLSRKIYFLNWILAAATLVGAIATAAMAYKAIYHPDI